MPLSRACISLSSQGMGRPCTQPIQPIESICGTKMRNKKILVYISSLLTRFHEKFLVVSIFEGFRDSQQSHLNLNLEMSSPMAANMVPLHDNSQLTLASVKDFAKSFRIGIICLLSRQPWDKPPDLIAQMKVYGL